MGSAASGRTITANADSDRLNERLADLRDELREAMADESSALNSLRRTEIVVSRANQRVRQCSARLALWQRELGDKAIVIDELSDSELVRISQRRNGDVARFDQGVKADARRRVG